MIKKQEILQTIKDKEDKILYSKILDQLIFCQKKYEVMFTDFLPLVKAIEIVSLINKYRIDEKIEIFGGYEGAERVMIAFIPEYLELNKSDFFIDVLEITYNSKYSKNLTHRDFLGSLIGTGIERAKIGDIIIEGEKGICFVERGIAGYLQANLERVGSVKVNVHLSGLKEYEIKEIEYEQKTIIISSLRIDTVLASAFNLSRGKITDLIKGEKVFLNWSLEKSSSRLVKDDDTITLRGVGRIKILGITGKTKKDRIVLNIIKYS